MELCALVKDYLGSSRELYKQKTYCHYQTLAETYLSKVVACSESSPNTFLPQGLSYSTQKVLKSLINRTLNYAHQNNYLQEKIKVTTKLKQEPKTKTKTFSELDCMRIEDYILSNHKYYSYDVLISLYSGLRIGELLALKWSDIDFENRLLTVSATQNDILEDHKFVSYIDTPKTLSSARQIPISTHLLGILKDLKSWQGERCEKVITGRTGEGVFIRAYQDSFSRLLKKLNIKHLGFHCLRHTFASRCYHGGMDIKSLSEILGHSNTSITMNIYVHSSMEQKLASLDMVNKKIGV